MKYREILINQLKLLPFFDKTVIYQLSKQHALKETTVDSYISRSLAHKDLIQLKKGLYVTTDFYDTHKADRSYPFYLANVIRKPSYVSSWAALQYYNLTTEAIYTITSVTPKVTRNYETKAGNFSYQSIKKELFSGYDLTNGAFDFFIASPSKALFDLLYFRTKQFRGVRLAEIDTIISDLRIDFEEMEKKERDAFHAMLKNYVAHNE